MKNLKLILLLQALVLGVLTVNAEDVCCVDGTDPAFDCEDGGDLVCDSGDCPYCSTHNPYPETDGYECCAGEEFDPSETQTKNNETLTFSFIIPEPARTLLSWLGATASGELGTTTNLWEGKDCCDDTVVDYERGDLRIAGDLEWELATQNIPALKGTINTLNEYADDLGAKVSYSGGISAGSSTDTTITQTWNNCERSFSGTWPYSVSVGGSGGITLKSIQSGNTLAGVEFSGSLTATATVANWSSLSLQWPSSFQSSGCFTLSIDVPFVDFLDVDKNWGSDC
jgi:hypothetical protein